MEQKNRIVGGNNSLKRFNCRFNQQKERTSKNDDKSNEIIPFEEQK